MYFLVLVVDGSRMSLMGSDTLSGTPGNQIAIAVAEVRSGRFSSAWEDGAPDIGNGVMWLMSTAFQSDQPSNLAFTFYYNFINTGPAVTGATMSCGVDNYGYIVLNGVKYPSTNGNMSLGYEGITTVGSFTVTIPPGLNTLELRVVNAGPAGNTTWQNQGILNGGPTSAWMIIKSSTGTLLVKTTDKWNCTQFNYPAKFIGPVSLGDVGENASLDRPYSLAALAGFNKVMYDNSRFFTRFTSPVSLFTAVGKTFVYPGTSTEFNWVAPDGSGIGNFYAWNVPIPVVSGTYSCRAVDRGNSSRFFSWTTTISGGTITATVPIFTGFVAGARIHSIASIPSYTYLYGNPGSISRFHTVDNLSLPPQTIVPGYFCIDFFHINQTDAIYVLTVTKTS